MEKIFTSLFLLFAFVKTCPFNASRMPVALSCIQQIVCQDSSNYSEVMVQNCNKKWYYGSSNASIAELTQASHSGSSFISENKKAKRLKMTASFALLSFNSSVAYHYPLGSSIYNYTLTPSAPFSDFSGVKLQNGTRLGVFLLSSAVQTLSFYSNNTILFSNIMQVGESLSCLTCLNDNQHCLVGSQNGDLILLDVKNSRVITNVPTGVSQPIVMISSGSAGTDNSYKIYLVYGDGSISQFQLVNNEDLTLERTSSLFKGEEVHNIASVPNSHYLIITDKAGNISQINLNTGILLDTINVASYLSDKSDTGMSLLLDTPTSYYIYNTLNSLIFQATVDSTTNSDKIVLSCFNMHFYDSQKEHCSPCSSQCATCSPLTGFCMTCIGQYFNKDGQCLSCYYNSEGLTDHFQECFSKTEQTVMETSEAVVQFLSVVVSNFATVVNLCGLLFLFLKLINNWNILCLYFFPAIELPFFLQNVLQMLFNNFNSSVLKAIGIELNLSLNAKNKFINSPKVSLMNLNSDFLEMNAESVILFLYSVVLTVTVYKFINFLLAKVNISIFQQNTAISILQQFVGCFTISTLPLYFVMARSNFSNFNERINLALYYLLLGCVMTIPFCFLIFDHEYTIIPNNKIHNNDENMIAESVNLGLTKRIKAWRQDDSKESFFYALFSFTTAALACHPNPQIFIFGVGAVNLLCLINAFTCKQRKINIIVQKLSFFAFHLCFSSFHYLSQGQIKFKIAIFLVILIVFIAAHELLLAIYKKVYFLYILIKGKIDKEARVEAFFRKNQEKLKEKQRAHPTPLLLRSNNKTTKKEIQFAFNNFEAKVVKETEKVIFPKTAREIKIKFEKRRSKSGKKIGDDSGSFSKTVNLASQAKGKQKKNKVQ